MLFLIHLFYCNSACGNSIVTQVYEKSRGIFFPHLYQKAIKTYKVCISILSLSNLAGLVFMQAFIRLRTHLSPSPPCRDDSLVYLAGLGTAGIELHDQVPKLDAVIVPAGGKSGVLVGIAAAIKHLNPHISVIVCFNKVLNTIHMQTILLILTFRLTLMCYQSF